jgi:hypothetical protein
MLRAHLSKTVMKNQSAHRGAQKRARANDIDTPPESDRKMNVAHNEDAAAIRIQWLSAHC